MINRDKEKISIKSISQQSGFTLVELLAVIALLSLMLFYGSTAYTIPILCA